MKLANAYISIFLLNRGDTVRGKGFSTQAIHAGDNGDSRTGSLSTPIYQTSTYVFDSVEDGAAKFAGEREGYIYSRLGNPTVNVFEQKMAVLERGESAVAFSSGMAAISAVVMGLVRTGDHVICTRGLYGCTFGFYSMLKEKFGVDFSLVDMSTEGNIAQAIKPNTTLIYIETPINPTMEMVDLAMVSALAKKNGAKVVVDNTFMSPYLQRPIEFGADIVVHSATKYIGGHGDLIAGVAVGPKEVMQQIRMTTQKDIGGILGPNEAFLLNRGLKTLAIRMDRHCSNGEKVAGFLAQHPRIKKVFYPGLPSFAQHELAKRQMDGFGGVISFEVSGGLTEAAAILNRLQMIKIAVSLGDAETLIQHPATMTHSVIPVDHRMEMGITDGLVRLSVGLEDVDDIISDLEYALSY
jgi:methionine-gamma-lyase